MIEFKKQLIIPCFYCKVKLFRKEATVDHVIPKSKGGLNKPENYVIACKKCNDDKGDSLYVWTFTIW